MVTRITRALMDYCAFVMKSCLKLLAENKLKYSLRLNNHYCYKEALVSDTAAGNDCLLGFVSWHDNPHMFMHMQQRDNTVSLKSGQNKVYC